MLQGCVRHFALPCSIGIGDFRFEASIASFLAFKLLFVAEHPHHRLGLTECRAATAAAAAHPFPVQIGSMEIGGVPRRARARPKRCWMGGKRLLNHTPPVRRSDHIAINK